MNTLYEYLWFLLIYAFFGWCSEVIYAALNSGKFVNRGFLHGPVCPIYGFGAVIIIACLEPISDNIALLFVGSAVLTTLLELVTGAVLEKLFHEKWWDYSDVPFNFKGYICLKFSLLWGFACCLAVRVVHPAVEGFVGIIPHVLGVILLSTALAAFAADASSTFVSAAKFARRLKALDEIDEALKKMSDGIGKELSDNALSLKKKSEKLIEATDEKKTEYREKSDEFKAMLARKNELLKSRAGHRRFVKAFPALGRGRHGEQLKTIAEKFQNSKL